jgi:hypothetical protein
VVGDGGGGLDALLLTGGSVGWGLDEESIRDGVNRCLDVSGRDRNRGDLPRGQIQGRSI